MSGRRRDYGKVIARVQALPENASRAERMRAVVDAIWDAFQDRGVSWVGFYLDQPDEPADRRLVLGPSRDKSACSPIGLHGVCGRALTSGRVMIVADVRELGGNYIACDPRDRSEIVIPLTDESGDCWGVLDLDSFETGAFNEHDAIGLARVLRAAGLGVGPVSPHAIKDPAPR